MVPPRARLHAPLEKLERSLGRAVVLCLALLAFALGPRAAHAQPDAAVSMPPRDVAILVQPSAARLAPRPADFQRIERGWLTLEFPASVRDRAEGLAREAEEFRGNLSSEFGQAVLESVLVRVARTPDQMAELAPEDAPPPGYAAGVAYPSAHLALLALQAPGTWEAPDLVELLRHELAHLALYDAVAGHHVPRWFDEGLAIHESGELPWARRVALADASLGKHLLPFADLDRGFPADHYDVNVAYAESADFVSFLLRDADRARFGSLVERVRAGAAFDRAIEDAYGTDMRKLEYEWRTELSRRFGIVPALTGGGLLWVIIVGLSGAAWVKRRRRAKEKLARWALEEAEMEASLTTAEQARTEKTPATPGEDEIPPRPTPSIPVVEHEGRWYTVH
ncbi:MAG TPA: peptidase MA family metallohydrolase [Polyangiaceae bacterium]|nr:peptidase MA family metallohydrolase [Polyangiaceae bacterium]